jgi:flagellin
VGQITIGSNIAALTAQRRLADASDGLSRTFERLSSGQRINRASDDAAGLAIADSLRVDARLYGAAIRNVSDGISLVAIATGTLGQQNAMLERLLELAEQSANGTFSSAQRTTMQREYSALISEFGRLGDSARFNGLDLLLGGRGGRSALLALQAGIRGGSSSQINVITSDTGTLSGNINLDQLQTADFNRDGVINTIDFLDLSSFTNGTQTRNAIFSAFRDQVIAFKVTDGSGQEREALVAFQYGSYFEGWSPQSIGIHVFVENAQGTGYTGTDDNLVAFLLGSSIVGETGRLNLSGPLSFSVEGVDLSLDFRGLTFTSEAATGLGTSSLELTGIESAERALAAMSVIRARLAQISDLVGRYGAVESRLTTSLALLQGAREASLSAEGRIRDTDITAESAQLVAKQILQQAGAAVLSQANQQPSLALQLLA